MARTLDETLRESTRDYLAKIDPDNPPSPAQIKADILDATRLQVQLENVGRTKGDQWKIPNKLYPIQIAEIMLHLYKIIRIDFAGMVSGEDYDMLGLYQTEGSDIGIYGTDKSQFAKVIHLYDYTITRKGIDEVLSSLKTYAPRKQRCMERDLIAVNNGIFDFKNKVLLPFSPEYVFTAKSRVDYNPNAINVVIHNNDDNTDWDVESWIQDLFDDPELAELTWELLGAILRPNVPWNKSSWFISDTGNNGKGTLCELMRLLAGEGTYASIPLTAFSKEFHLEPLIKANAVIVDENSVGIFIDSADNFKAAVTGDVILANRKQKTPVALRFRGMIIECVNEIPRVRDRSVSFMRRLLFVPFKKCFTGAERKYIKYDYLHRKEVLEYVLFKVMQMDNYELSNPTACKEMMGEFRVNNDPVAQFVEEILPECKWDLLPNQFLYDLYSAWHKENCPGSSPLSKKTFLRDIRRVLDKSNVWDCPEVAVKVGQKMNAAEPLIMRYKLENWTNPTYKGDDVEKICHPELSSSYRGIHRRTT